MPIVEYRQYYHIYLYLSSVSLHARENSISTFTGFPFFYPSN